ncbi:MAG TPA: sigma 54-interacting transcriptional regulator [Clostridiales bacterium]|nr:sigma 54-interacting transcriptional regulator [Clostridiales bacterium]
MNKDIMTKGLFIDIIEHLYVAVYIIDKDGNMIYLNQAAKKMDHLEDEEVLGENLAEIYCGTVFQESMNSPCLDTLNSGKPHIQENLEWFLADGARVNAITSTYPIKEKGEIKGVYAISENVEQLKKHLIKEGAFGNKKTYRFRNKMMKNGTQYVFNDIIGESELIKNAIAMARRFAAKKLPIMIYGETGTGKEMFAQSIHNASSFVAGPFMPINCAAIPETLLESILFGTAKGAFTGAVDNPGLLEKAENGTVFLDEINSMPVQLQAKLLRALQEKEVQRIGDNKVRKLHCRIISATNQLPSDAIRAHELREDLFYRLSTGMIWIPSLHERSEDIDALVDFFIVKNNEEMETTILAPSAELKKLFHAYLWPGNIRELANAVESSMNMTTPGETTLDLRHLPTYLKQHFSEELASVPEAQAIFSLRNEHRYSDMPVIHLHNDINTMVDSYEKEILKFALTSTRGHLCRCSEKLGISRQSLSVKLKKYNLDPQKFKIK